MEFVPPMSNAHPYFSLKNLGESACYTRQNTGISYWLLGSALFPVGGENHTESDARRRGSLEATLEAATQRSRNLPSNLNLILNIFIST